MSKVISLEQAADLIKDGDSVAWSTVGMSYFPEAVADKLEQRFLATGHPQNLTLIHDCGCGDGKDAGMSHLAHPGLVKRLISGHTGQAPKMAGLVSQDAIEAYLLPQGVLTTMWRQIAGNKPGVITKVGMGTYVDPLVSGGKVTSLATEDLVKRIQIEEEEWLLYKTFPLDVVVIRATTADENGNLSVEEEAMLAEILPMAQAARNRGGIVIAQVKYLAEAKTLAPKDVKVPGVIVDYVTVAPPEQHMQTIVTDYNPALAGNSRVPLNAIPPVKFGERKVIARRAAMELKANAIVNLGIGMPDGVASIAAEENVADKFMLTTELGTYGGIPASGGDFGAAWNPEAIIEHEAQFDFYDGGGLDIAFLGLAQADQSGNLNVSKFGPKVVGPGGFINISQSAKKIVFCGTLVNGAKLAIKDGQLTVLEEGRTRKFVKQVDHITFSGEFAQANNKPVLFITERCVLELRPEGMVLTEIAPGLDLEKDVLSMIDFTPIIADDLKTMPQEIFQEVWGGLNAYMNV
ncbi:acyl CoA:acetate/3-ketoacid CoA transferase [Marinomonas piezotolerans]|uniref:Acetate CoA-transferase YdiF n=1 Tax=Marinomonas piezotolerans TaxID=2213058 RepID=A0A370U9J5_9GAMM|nr:CoA-transferase [Marinomonas piezotolerans]RDL44459.1 acyl CoA:acetate/3-ketoacid CoA transferase [Marinomonas piezotolerans]